MCKLVQKRDPMLVKDIQFVRMVKATWDVTRAIYNRENIAKSFQVIPYKNPNTYKIMHIECTLKMNNREW